MSTFAIEHTVTDEYTFFVPTHIFVEAKSKEEIKNEFTNLLIDAIENKEYSFEFLNHTFYVHNHYRIENKQLGIKGQTEHFSLPEILTLNELPVIKLK